MARREAEAATYRAVARGVSSRSPALAPIRPGTLLREDVPPAAGLSVAEATRRLGVSRQTLHIVLGGRQGVTLEMALRLDEFFSNGPELWPNMHQAYDLWHAHARLGDVIEQIQTVRAA